MIQKTDVLAIIGASNNPEKFGNKVLIVMSEAGYKTIPINPKEAEIEGQKAYKSVLEYPNSIDVAVFIVHPAIVSSILPQVKEKGIKTVWLQPGSESDIAINYCTEHNINCFHDLCIMVETGSLPKSTN